MTWSDLNIFYGQEPELSCHNYSFLSLHIIQVQTWLDKDLNT